MFLIFSIRTVRLTITNKVLDYTLSRSEISTVYIYITIHGLSIWNNLIGKSVHETEYHIVKCLTSAFMVMSCCLFDSVHMFQHTFSLNLSGMITSINT